MAAVAIAEHLAKATSLTDSFADRKTGAFAFAEAVAREGAHAARDVIEKLRTAANDKKNANVREGAMLCIAALAEKKSTSCEPYLMPLLPLAIEKAADAKAVAEAANVAAQALVTNANPTGVKNLLPWLFDGLVSKNKWQSRVLAINLIGSLPKSAPRQTALALPEIVPKVAEIMGDARVEVSKGAEQCLIDVCQVVGNKDIEPFIPTLVSCIARPEEVSECVYKLSATTFVQAVEPPTLAIMVPVLERGLKERGAQTRRLCSVIIDNMCKLVEVPAYAAPFLPKLLPGLDRTKEEVSDPEVRKVAARAHAQLLKAAGEEAGKTLDNVAGNVAAEPVKMGALLAECLSDARAKAKDEVLFKTAFDYAVVLACALSDSRLFGRDEWLSGVADYLSPHVGDKLAEEATDVFRMKTESLVVIKVKQEDDEEGEVVCDCEFSLAYGAKILLNTARLALKRGRRYGLCGANGAGKSTLMRSIANGQLEGFPDPEIVRTVYVEHDIQADGDDYTVQKYVEIDPKLKDVSPADITAMLLSVGFSQHMINNSITALSGGWKMKLALARAMLTKPDIMLLDEPTNHLDKINVAWLVNYLKNLTNVTSMVVSHDSSFLDNVCTDIIHYEGFKLKKYKGNLSEFVKVKPEARSYYELAATTINFAFPEPGMLEGVNSKGKAILKMQRVTYKYPSSDRWIVTDVSINVSLSSRVVVVGPNGAGKSTMIKLLTGEIANPATGIIWRHPNVRIAYVAQHAFHHIEQHIDKTPNEYMQWRYSSGEDKEAVDKESAKITAEEEKKMAEKVQLDGAKYVVEQVLNRRKLKSSYEYEVSFVGLAADKNKWLPRKWLEDNGFDKLVNQLDAREAAAAGLHSKPLTAANIAKHFAEVGLESEFTLHSRMRGLSGGQKVKVVLAAAMWHNPHMLVLDEPTNYLDRDSLGALAAAIKGFGGGVILITHNAEFANHICSEVWLVDQGKLNISGESWTKDEKLIEKAAAEEVIDAAGNVIKVTQKKKELTRQEMKKVMKTRLAKIKKGEDVSDEEPWMAEFMGEA